MSEKTREARCAQVRILPILAFSSVEAAALEPVRPGQEGAIIKDDVLLGINSGEWGGGLPRVDRRTGRVS
jgi:hypothetical protein